MNSTASLLPEFRALEGQIRPAHVRCGKLIHLAALTNLHIIISFLKRIGTETNNESSGNLLGEILFLFKMLFAASEASNKRGEELLRPFVFLGTAEKVKFLQLQRVLAELNIGREEIWMFLVQCDELMRTKVKDFRSVFPANEIQDQMTLIILTFISNRSTDHQINEFTRAQILSAFNDFFSTISSSENKQIDEKKVQELLAVFGFDTVTTYTPVKLQEVIYSVHQEKLGMIFNLYLDLFQITEGRTTATDFSKKYLDELEALQGDAARKRVLRRGKSDTVVLKILKLDPKFTDFRGNVRGFKAGDELKIKDGLISVDNPTASKPLEKNNIVAFGRFNTATKNDVCINLAEISKQHFSLSWDENLLHRREIVVTNHSKTNPTKIAVQKNFVLRPGMMFSLGDLQLKVQVLEMSYERLTPNTVEAYNRYKYFPAKLLKEEIQADGLAVNVTLEKPQHQKSIEQVPFVKERHTYVNKLRLRFSEMFANLRKHDTSRKNPESNPNERTPKSAGESPDGKQTMQTIFFSDRDGNQFEKGIVELVSDSYHEFVIGSSPDAEIYINSQVPGIIEPKLAKFVVSPQKNEWYIENMTSNLGTILIVDKEPYTMKQNDIINVCNTLFRISIE